LPFGEMAATHARRNSPGPAAFPAEVQQLLARRVGLHNAVVTRVHNINIAAAVHHVSMRTAQAAGRCVLERDRRGHWRAGSRLGGATADPPAPASLVVQAGRASMESAANVTATRRPRVQTAGPLLLDIIALDGRVSLLASLVGPAGNGQTDTIESRQVSTASVSQNAVGSSNCQRSRRNAGVNSSSAALPTPSLRMLSL
jgi:hypothetical protein